MFETLSSFCCNLGDDVQKKTLKYYIAFKRIKNFACVEIQPKISITIKIYLKVDPTTITLEKGFSRDVGMTGHYGTGDLELTIRTMEDLGKAQPLIELSYQRS